MPYSFEEDYNSGLHSDAKVTCGNRTWDLHKVILRNCLFFKKAFDGQFKEAHECHVTLPDHQPQDVQGVIFYIYTGKVSSDLEKDESVAAYTQMFKLGDYFDLEGLRLCATDCLEDALLPIAKNVNRNWNNKEWDLQIPSEELDVVSQVAKFAYGTDSHTYAPLRNIFLRFIAISGMRAIHLDQFLALTDDLPVLGNAIFKAWADKNSPLGEFCLSYIADRCSDCNEPLDNLESYKATPLGDIEDVSSIKYDIRTRCAKCQDAI
ncbi:hypothetical protein PG996_006844 [Apiospora saccharicola]|uniref:BTB domain-containing protein n=1 Tax=Apiospora saccharicola TaxID=335842 RepID=A0ABR1VA10_9PEZI